VNEKSEKGGETIDIYIPDVVNRKAFYAAVSNFDKGVLPYY